RTPEENVRAIRALQIAASSETKTHFAIEPDGSFLLDVIMIEASAAWAPRLPPKLLLHRTVERLEPFPLSGEHRGELRVGLGHIGDFGGPADDLGRFSGRRHPREPRGAVSGAGFAALHANDGKAGRRGDHARP